MQAQTELLIMLSKLTEYTFFADRLYSNLHVGPSLRTETSFFLLSIFVDVLISTPKII